MAASSELTELIIDQLAEFGPVTSRAMFGGVGFFRQGLMFGLIANDMFFLKSDAETRPNFEAENLKPFGYDSKKGKKTVMSYHQAPDRTLEDADEMMTWAQEAFAAAIRADNAKPPSKRKYCG